MRGLVVVAVLGGGAARADVATEPVELLDGRVSIDVPAGSMVNGNRVVVDDAGTGCTLVARDLGAVQLETVRDHIAQQLRVEGQLVARIEPLAVARPNVGYAASVGAPRIVDGRELVYAAFAVDRGGRLHELAFFADASDALEPSRRLAARIAATMRVRTAHAPVAIRPAPAPAPVEAKSGATAAARIDHVPVIRMLFSSPGDQQVLGPLIPIRP